jgi:hypothetical protein
MSIIPADDATLSQVETVRLSHYEHVIQSGIAQFMAVGEALTIIRDERLYRKTHHSFEAYCQAKWNLTARHANRLIVAADVVEDLRPIGLTETAAAPVAVAIPTNEAQVRPLAALPAEERRTAWANANAAAGAGNVTARHVQEAVTQLRSHPTMNQMTPTAR